MKSKVLTLIYKAIGYLTLGYLSDLISHHSASQLTILEPYYISIIPSISLPLGLCICHSFCPEHSSPGYSYGLLPYILCSNVTPLREVLSKHTLSKIATLITICPHLYFFFTTRITTCS